MTTIAWDGVTLAADRRASSNGAPIMEVQKIHRTPNGALVGASGNYGACWALCAWVQAGAQGDPPVSLSSDDWGDILMVDPDGTLFLWGVHGRFPLANNRFAIGSGAAYALAAMACGRTAVEAVALAAEFDHQTGTLVDTLTLLKSKRRRPCRKAA